MAVQFREAPKAVAPIIFVNVHAKEPKDATAAKVLADFILEMGRKVGGVDARGDDTRREVGRHQSRVAAAC